MKSLALDNDWEPEYLIRRKDTDTGDLQAASGLTGLTCRVSLTDGGLTIDPSLDKSLTERGTTGLYFCIFDGDVLRTHLATKVGKTVYEVMGDGTNILRSVPRKVVWPARP